MPPVTVATASGAVELSATTAEELAKRLQLLVATRPAASAFETAENGTVELDADGRRSVLDALTYWLDSAGRAFPDDARSLFRALAGELLPRSGL
jgi:hypothetical protein